MVLVKLTIPLSLPILLTCFCVITQGYVKQKASVLLLRMVPTSVQQLVFLESLKNNRSDLRIQLWRHPDKLLQHVDLWISETSLAKFRKRLKSVDLTFKVICKDIVKAAGKPNLSMNNIEDYDHVYQKVDDITSEIRRLAVTYPDTVTAGVIGKSSEGREIYKAHIHRNASLVKPILFVLCGTHSREWLSISSCQYVLRKLVFDQNYDEEIIELLSEYDVIMVPLLNPDGYRFSLKKSRMWRKSRSKTSDNRCWGVDINRNFNYRWGGGGSSSDPCEEIYCGQKPFSESEALAVARYLYKLRRNLASFMDIHTYGQLWMSPWGFTTGFPRDYVRQEEALKRIQQTIKEKNGVLYKIGRSSKTLYQTSGDALDWVYGMLGIIHTYGIELRPMFSDNPRFNGFQRNHKEIIPTAQDLLVGLKALAFLMINEKNTRH